GLGGAHLFDVQSDGPDQYPLGSDHPLVDLPLRAVPDVGLRLPGGPHRAHGGGPDRRFGRVSYLRHGGTATPGPAHRYRTPLHHGREVDQLLPAVDHDPRPRLVPVDPETERMERAGVHRGWRSDLPPGHHRFAPDHRAADRGILVAPALLAVGTVRGQPQGLTHATCPLPTAARRLKSQAHTLNGDTPP